MKTLRLSCIGTLLLGLTPCTVLAQASAPVAVLPGASGPAVSKTAPSAVKPPPQLPTAQQKRDQAAETGDLRPDRPVTQQLTIPLGKSKGPPQRTGAAPRNGSTAGGSAAINDAAARCNAESDPQVRADCRAGLTPAKKSAKP